MENRANKTVKDFKTESGLRALIVLVGGSHHCGYVAVDKNHALYGVGYDGCGDIDVHGGLTYSSKKGDYGDMWWLGFDCAHVGDKMLYENMSPAGAQLSQLMGMFDSGGGDFRDADYVEKECESLAQQLMSVS